MIENTYTSSSLTFHDDKIVCKMEEYGDEEILIMMIWEHPAMSASAAYVTQNGGDILEIGFGMGISAGYMHSHSINSHTIVENHPEIIPKAVEWANGKSNVTIISQSWADVTGSLSTYDGIFYDTHMDYRSSLLSSSLSSLTKNGTRFTYWNSNDPSNDSSQMNLSNVTYKTISVSPTISSSQYFPSGSTTYYMPMREF